MDKKKVIWASVLVVVAIVVLVWGLMKVGLIGGAEPPVEGVEMSLDAEGGLIDGITRWEGARYAHLPGVGELVQSVDKVEKDEFFLPIEWELGAIANAATCLSHRYSRIGTERKTPILRHLRLHPR